MESLESEPSAITFPSNVSRLHHKNRKVQMELITSTVIDNLFQSCPPPPPDRVIPFRVSLIHLNTLRLTYDDLDFFGYNADIISTAYQKLSRPSSVAQFYLNWNLLPQFLSNLSDIWLQGAQCCPKKIYINNKIFQYNFLNDYYWGYWPWP